MSFAILVLFRFGFEFHQSKAVYLTGHPWTAFQYYVYHFVQLNYLAREMEVNVMTTVSFFMSFRGRSVRLTFRLSQ